MGLRWTKEEDESKKSADDYDDEVNDETGFDGKCDDELIVWGES